MARSIWLPLASSLAVLPNAAFALWLGAAAAIAQDSIEKEGVQPPPRRASAALEDAFHRVQKLSSADTVVLAAQGTPEGHWRFVNKSGEMFTVGTPDEMKRVVTVLYPEAKAGTRLALYLTEDTVLGKGVRFRALPAGAERHIVVGEKSHRLLPATGEPRYAQVDPKSPNVWIEVRDNPLLKEALGRLAEPLGKAGVRLLVLEPGSATKALSPLAAAGKAAQGERIDPVNLATALAGLSRQTLVVCGRGEGDLIYARSAAGLERGIRVSELLAAAEGADVALVVLQFASTLQTPAAGGVTCPAGGRPASELTLADILDAAAVLGQQAPVAVALAGRFEILDAATVGSDPTTRTAVRLGNARQSRWGLVADLPVPLPAPYVGMLMLGWLGTPVARSWWGRVWSAGDAADYRGRTGYWAACVVSFLGFALVFQPVTGVVTALVNLGPQIWAAIRPAVWGVFVVLRWIARLGGGGKLKKRQTGQQSV
ncbi:MAG: hypothetical protein WAN86_13950 [Hyphomicrobiaceae bacterium]